MTGVVLYRRMKLIRTALKTPARVRASPGSERPRLGQAQAQGLRLALAGSSSDQGPGGPSWKRVLIPAPDPAHMGEGAAER